MNQFLNLLWILVLFIPSVHAQHTFSIVAVDVLTGEVGGAGATCLDNIMLKGEEGALVINDIIPGKGVIHSQAEWIPENQLAARQRMMSGESPARIIDWLVQNDSRADGKAAMDRQYGIVDLYESSSRTSAFTGGMNPSYAGHLTGPNYSIQGNVISGPEVLKDMQRAFLNTGGDLAARLMAAMQEAKRVGADIRCAKEGVSSLSAFLRVAQPDDVNAEYGKLSLDINVGHTPDGIDPIDVLQLEYESRRTKTAGTDGP